MPDPVPHDRLSANRVFDAVEHLPDLPGHRVKLGIMDEERSASGYVEPLRHAARRRVKATRPAPARAALTGVHSLTKGTLHDAGGWRGRW